MALDTNARFLQNLYTRGPDDYRLYRQLLHTRAGVVLGCSGFRGADRFGSNLGSNLGSYLGIDARFRAAAADETAGKGGEMREVGAEEKIGLARKGGRLLEENGRGDARRGEAERRVEVVMSMGKMSFGSRSHLESH